MHHRAKLLIDGFALGPAKDGVNGDHLGLAAVHIADHLGPDAARPRPATELVFEGLEAGVINVDDDNAGVGLRLFGPQPRPLVEGPVLKQLARRRARQRQHGNGRNRDGNAHTHQKLTLDFGVLSHPFLSHKGKSIIRGRCCGLYRDKGADDEPVATTHLLGVVSGAAF